MTPLKSKLNSILPDTTDSANNLPFSNYEELQREELINESVESDNKRRTAAELARLKLNAKSRLAEARSKPAPSPEKVKEAEDALRTIGEIETQKAKEAALRVDKIAAPSTSPKQLQEALRLQGPSRGDISNLLKSLNINTSIQLTKQDTSNLLACLLTCNETQLRALMSNSKVPIVIKTVIKRLLDDSKVGSIDTVEKLWDRIFGKTGMVQSLPEAAQTQVGQGLIPG